MAGMLHSNRHNWDMGCMGELLDVKSPLPHLPLRLRFYVLFIGNVL